RRHTRSTRDWSSDVCSSDLKFGAAFCLADAGPKIPTYAESSRRKLWIEDSEIANDYRGDHDQSCQRQSRTQAKLSPPARFDEKQIGRASCREQGGRGERSGC